MSQIEGAQSMERIKVLYDDGGFRNAYSGVARYFTEMLKRFPDDIA